MVQPPSITIGRIGAMIPPPVEGVFKPASIGHQNPSRARKHLPEKQAYEFGSYRIDVALSGRPSVRRGIQPSSCGTRRARSRRQRDEQVRLQQSSEVAERIGAAFERDGARLEHDRLHEITERRSR